MYTGHFVVVCGYNSVTERYLIRDPARSDPNGSEVDWRTFEASLFYLLFFGEGGRASLTLSLLANSKQAARRAFGTDEDLLLLRVAKHCACPL